MQIIENWSLILANIESIQDKSSQKGYALLNLKVITVENVDHYNNLMLNDVNQVISVYFPRDIIQEIKLNIGTQIQCQVRKTAPKRYFVHREHINLMSEK